MVELSRPVLDIGLVVRDFEKALEFYRDKLGMTPTRQIPVDAETAREGGVAGGAFDIQYMEFGDVNLKLVHFPDAPPAGPAGADGQSGFRYITMWVKDMASTYEEWRAKGVDFLSEPIRRTPEMQMVFMRDPEGNLIEILGP
ncbi:MAG: VOC family protein [Nitrospinota bacterium]|jgi:catechol 2,3-dioxygenase-like lactoylglutathione lyase family enzyme|nr:VOC family protein [Nitrospinota bacterium]MDP7166268.1 VOC family protein [Nitrospinota bacterium]MDP7369634.1 VOC family protein [Nitrospinota bacterium]MDP7504041.1 VOC family protein [Nitrospinota bacterium]MDP7662558.1 VOC family protein [Nitrospinota bacterium]